MFGGVVTVEYLIVAGGGSGGATPVGGTLLRGGGGGAGDFLTGSLHQSPGVYPVLVGLGGAARPAGSGRGLGGGPSSAFDLVVNGGGGGGAPGTNGLAGGSGGGGGSTLSGSTIGGAATGLGYAGAGGSPSGTWGGGGGAGGVALGTKAGPGVASSISGMSLNYSRGGDGTGSIDLTPGCGGTIGNSADDGAGGAGRDGVVIIRYFGPQRATGGTVTSFGGYTIHTFTSDGVFTL